MFVRWTTRSGRLSARLAHSTRADGRVAQEHIATLGSLPAASANNSTPKALGHRRAFWRSAEAALARLSNRLDNATAAAIRGQLHKQVPMLAPEDIDKVALDRAETDVLFWQAHSDYLRALIVTRTRVIADQQGQLSSEQQQLEAAQRSLAEASERVARAKAGLPIGEGEPLTPQRIKGILAAGMTPRQVRRLLERARRWGRLSEEEFEDALRRRRQR
jgi:hypothetical protein